MKTHSQKIDVDVIDSDHSYRADSYQCVWLSKLAYGIHNRIGQMAPVIAEL